MQTIIIEHQFKWNSEINSFCDQRRYREGISRSGKNRDKIRLYYFSIETILLKNRILSLTQS